MTAYHIARRSSRSLDRTNEERPSSQPCTINSGNLCCAVVVPTTTSQHPSLSLWPNKKKKEKKTEQMKSVLDNRHPWCHNMHDRAISKVGSRAPSKKTRSKVRVNLIRHRTRRGGHARTGTTSVRWIPSWDGMFGSERPVMLALQSSHRQSSLTTLRHTTSSCSLVRGDSPYRTCPCAPVRHTVQVLAAVPYVSMCSLQLIHRTVLTK